MKHAGFRHSLRCNGNRDRAMTHATDEDGGGVHAGSRRSRGTMRGQSRPSPRPGARRALGLPAIAASSGRPSGHSTHVMARPPSPTPRSMPNIRRRAALKNPRATNEHRDAQVPEQAATRKATSL